MKKDSLQRLRTLCLGLPEATEKKSASGEHSSFLVRKKTFAMYLDNHHGDGRVAMWSKARPGLQQALVGSDPKRFFVPPYVGPKGWVGVSFDVKIDWEEVTRLVRESYRMTAPTRLVALLEPLPETAAKKTVRKPARVAAKPPRGKTARGVATSSRRKKVP
jgi:hypothetical protein